MRVSECYTRNVATLRTSDRLSDVMRAFLKHRLDIACVLDETDRLAGIVSKYAVYRALLEGAGLDTPVETLLRREVVTLDVRDSLESAKATLLRTGVGHGVVVDPDGRVLGVMGKSDIIRGFLHQTELQALQVTALLDNLQEAVIFVDRQQRIQTVNRAAERMFGLDRERALGTPAGDWFPELSRGLVDALERRVPTPACRVSRGQNVSIASLIPIADQDVVRGAMAVFRDITSLEAIAEELETTKNLEHILRHALALSYDGIAVVDPEGRITVVNNAFLEALDRPDDDVAGRPWSEVVPDLSLEPVLSGRPVIGEVRTIQGRPCVVTQEPIERSGKRLGAIIKIIWRQLDEWRALFRRLEQLERELHFYRGEWNRVRRPVSAFDRIVGADPKIERLKQEARLAAQTSSTILITGESGTGKELFAEAIHEESGRPGRFVKVNCAAIPAELLESEFFGYVEGAFTGARRGGKPGKFELADGGTLFLDEIGDMPLYLQAKLLRVLQEQAFERVGDVRTRRVDVRIIAATHRDLRQMVREGAFREDLYYRIHVVHLAIPPLRERMGDLPMLCEYLIQKLNQKLNRHVIGITPRALEVLQAYSWPGNVRQLENVLERAMNMGVDGWIEPGHLPEEIRAGAVEGSAGGPNGPKTPARRSRESWERDWILEALQESGGNRSKAAQLLGISRSTLYQKLRKYGIEEEIRFHLRPSRVDGA